MSRPLRLDVEGGYYHVASRGTERRAICGKLRDRQHWVELLGRLPERFGVRVHAWVLLDNHYHLQIETPEANLSEAMQWFNGSYATWFNRKHERVGPLFQGRFKAELTDTERWVAEVNRYIHLNPVRVIALGLGKGSQAASAIGQLSEPPGRDVVKERLARLEEYRWSSCRAYLGLERAPNWLTVDQVRGQFGGRNRTEQIRNYRRALEASLREGREEEPWEGSVGEALLGGREFVDRIRDLLEGPKRDVPGSRALARRRSFESWCGLMEKMRREGWAEISGRHADPARDLVLLAAREKSGYKLVELAEKVGLDYGTVSNALYRIRRRIKEDRQTRKEWDDLVKCSNQET